MSFLDEIRAELKKRIQYDMEPQQKWAEKLWTKISYGDYYGKSVERRPIILRVIGETVDKVLKPRNLQMTASSWVELQNAIEASDTPETSLIDMDEAAADNEPRENGEHPIF